MGLACPRGLSPEMLVPGFQNFLQHAAPELQKDTLACELEPSPGQAARPSESDPSYRIALPISTHGNLTKNVDTPSHMADVFFRDPIGVSLNTVGGKRQRSAHARIRVCQSTK